MLFRSDAEDQPMWAQFLNADQMDVVMGGKRSEERMTNLEKSSDVNETEIEVSDDYDDEIFAESEPISPDKSTIILNFKEILDDRRVEFLDVIFKSSEPEFESALNKLSECNNWQEASNYIKNEIFTKHDVDLFSGATVDFTDRMHRYFNEQTHS